MKKRYFGILSDIVDIKRDHGWWRSIGASLVGIGFVILSILAIIFRPFIWLFLDFPEIIAQKISKREVI